MVVLLEIFNVLLRLIVPVRPDWNVTAPPSSSLLPPGAVAPTDNQRAIARKIVPGLLVRGALVQMGPHRIDRARWDWAEVERNAFFCPDAKHAALYEDYLDGVRKSGSSTGAVIEVVAEGVPPGLGAASK